jgi:hypothetical protein
MRDFEPTYDQVWPLAPIPFIRSEPRQVRSTLDTGPKVEVERPLFGATTRPMQCSKRWKGSAPPRGRWRAADPLLQHVALLFERMACEIIEGRGNGARLQPIVVRLAHAGRIDWPDLADRLQRQP